MKFKKSISFFEMCVMVLSTMAFAYLIGASTSILPIVEASPYVPNGCCLEANDGSICQNMVFSDSSLCKSGLVGTNCEEVSSCQLGCCYESNSGLCSLNSPKTACANNGGNWSLDKTCNIPQCQLGCCILGDQVAQTTTRECTLLSDEY